MTDFNKIERQIEKLQADDLLPADMEFLVEEAAQSMRLLLDVARAADEMASIGAQSTRMEKALTALREHCQ